MKNIKIFDTTLRDWAQTAWVNMTSDKKIAIAKKIDDFWIDMIEAGFAISSIWDFNAIKTIANNVKAKVYSLARLNYLDIDAAYNALSSSKNRWIHTFIWTSPMHRDFKLKMSKTEILDEINDKVSYARSKFNNDLDSIMFSPEDALRTELDFLFEAVEVAIKAWANEINIPDTVWFAQPEEIYDIIKSLSDKYVDTSFSIHTHNDLWNAVANSLSAIKWWANIVQWTFPPTYWERAWNADIIQVLMNIIKRRDIYNVWLNSNIDMRKSSDLVQFISNSIWKRISENHPITGWDVFKHSSWIHQDWANKNKSTYEIISPDEIWYKIEQSFILTNQSWRAWLKNAVMIYFWIDLNNEDLDSIFSDFKDLTSNSIWTVITMDHIRDILIKNWLKLERNILVKDYNIALDADFSKASIELEIKWEKKYAISSWVGPVDAIYKSILQASWLWDINLIDFTISSLSSNPSSEAKVSIKVNHNWKIYEEFWVDRDIVKASIQAFVNCLDRVK